jgi:hypothetical protein
MKIEATIIYPDGREEKISPANGNDFSLEEVQKIVGGYIEVVGLSDGNILVLNEEGKLCGLDENPKATVIAHEHKAMFPHDYIVGNVLICSSDMLK